MGDREVGFSVSVQISGRHGVRFLSNVHRRHREESPAAGNVGGIETVEPHSRQIERSSPAERAVSVSSQNVKLRCSESHACEREIRLAVTIPVSGGDVGSGRSKGQGRPVPERRRSER